MRALFLSVMVVLAVGCGDDGADSPDARGGDAATDAGAGESDAACITNPQTHQEIINACTTAEKIYKTPTLPLLLPDGGLPALP